MSSMTITEFADKVAEVAPVIMREFMKSLYGDISKLKMTAPQLFILDIVSRQGEAKMSDIAKFLHVSTASVTGVTDKLVRDAYVAREGDESDRRVVRIKLTQKGSRLINTMNEKRREALIKMFGKLSQADRDSYLRILNQVKQGAEGN